MYEYCRLTTTILLRAADGGCSLKQAAAGTGILSEIRNALIKSDLYGLWGEHTGLLWWVFLIYVAVPAHHCFKSSNPFYLVRFSAAICQDDCHLAVARGPIEKFAWFEKMCQKRAETVDTQDGNCLHLLPPAPAQDRSSSTSSLSDQEFSQSLDCFGSTRAPKSSRQTHWLPALCPY